MTDQSAQQTVPPVSVETATGSQTSASGPENNKKPPVKVIIVGGFFLILAAFVIGAGIYYSQKQPPASVEPSPAASPISNLKTAEGRIVQVDHQANSLVVESTVPGVRKTWKIVITEKTTLANMKDWQEESKAESFVGGKTFGQIKESVKKLTLENFKEGDTIYIIAYPEQDLASEEQIIGPNVLLLET